MKKAALKTSTTLSSSEKTPAQLVAEQHNAGIPPGPKAAAPMTHIETVTRLESEKAAEYFLDAAVAVANDAKRMICAGVVCFFIGRHFSQATPKPELGTVDTFLLGKLINGGANKGMSTLKAWITTSRRIYLRMTNPTGAKQMQEKFYAGIVNDIRTAKSVEAAVDTVQKWLCKQTIGAGDGKEYNAGDSIDLMQRWADYVPAVTKQDTPRAKELNTAGASVARAIETMIEKANASPAEVASTVINNVAASRASPLDLVNAALARVDSNIKSIEALLIQQFTMLVSKDRDAARKTLSDMTAYLASADKAASEKPLAAPPAPSATATPENTALAAASNTAQSQAASLGAQPAPTEASDQPSKPAKAKGKRAA